MGTRAVCDPWLEKHKASLEAALAQAVNDAITARAESPITFVAQRLMELSGVGDATVAVSSVASAPSESAEWNCTAWLGSLGLHAEAGAALEPLLPAETSSRFDFVRTALTRDELTKHLAAAGLAGLVGTIWAGVCQLQEQAAATGRELNAKFSLDGAAFEMGFGSLAEYYAGLEALVGPPLLATPREGALLPAGFTSAPSHLAAMEREHCAEADARAPFSTSNGMHGVRAAEE